MYTYKELNRYTVKQLKMLAKYEGKTIPKGAKKAKILDLLLQLELPKEVSQPCSVRIQRIKDSSKE